VIDTAPDIDSKEKTFPPPSPQWVSLCGWEPFKTVGSVLISE
jgi:hypothetical protein